MARTVKQAKNPAHQKWWDAAIGRLALVRGVDLDVAEAAVNEALDEAEAAGETPEDMWGDARVWADEKAEEWRSGAVTAGSEELPTVARNRGLDPFANDRLTPKLAVLFMMGSAGLWSVAAAVMGMIADFDLVTSRGALVALPVLGAGVLGVYLVFEALKRRMPLVKSAGVVTIAAVALVAVTTWIFMAFTEPARYGALILIGIGIALFVLLFVIAKVWRESPDDLYDPASRGTSRMHGPAADRGNWRSEFIATMRGRTDYTEQHIQQLATEAETYANESGRSVGEEFGDPVAYARSLPVNEIVPAKRNLLLTSVIFAAVAVFLGYSVLGSGFSWSDDWLPVLWFALAVFLLVTGILRYRRARAGVGARFPRA